VLCSHHPKQQLISSSDGFQLVLNGTSDLWEVKLFQRGLVILVTMVTELYQEEDAMAMHQAIGRDGADEHERMEEATTALKMLGSITDPGAVKAVSAFGRAESANEETVVAVKSEIGLPEEEGLEAWMVPSYYRSMMTKLNFQLYLMGKMYPFQLSSQVIFLFLACL
jgi:hypothetical protein